MNVEYLDLADFIAIAQAVTGLDLQTVMNVTNIDLADSALHAPSAGFGDEDFFPDFIDKAAVLLVRLARNHPLPDGNKRAAWVSLRLFVEINEWTWDPKPAIEDAEAAVLAVAGGEWDEGRTADWLRTRRGSRRHCREVARALSSASAHFPRSATGSPGHRYPCRPGLWGGNE